MIKEYQTNIFFQILEKIVLKFKIAVIWFLALINFNFSISTIFCCICRWCSHFLDNLKEKSPKLEIKKKFYFHLISTFTQSCQKSEFYWGNGTQKNPNIKSARFCIVFMSSRILLCLQHCDIFNLTFSLKADLAGGSLCKQSRGFSKLYCLQICRKLIAQVELLSSASERIILMIW